MTPNTDDLTAQLYALFVATRMRAPVTQGEVRAFVESMLEAARAPVRKRSRRKHRTHEEIKAEIDRQRRGDRG